MVQLVSSIVVPSIISAVLEEAVKRIAKKVAEGKRLSDSEIVILILDQVNKRIEVGFDNVDKRFEDLREYVDRRFNDLKEYVDRRFNDIDKRFEDIDRRFGDIDRRFDDLKTYVDKRFDGMNRRFEDLRVYVDKRISELSANVRLLTEEVSSIKSDVIALMKERLERK